MNRITLATLAASVFVGLPAHAQNLILNGSFESPSIAANSILQTTPVSWLGGNQPIIINGDYSPGIPLPQDGQQYADLGHFPSLSQAAFLSQAFTVSSPGSYVLNWYDSTEFNGPGNSSPYSVTVSDGAANVVTAANLDANATGLRVWKNRALTLTLPADAYTLRFEGHVAASGEGSLIDNVSLLFVPEPTGGVLLLCGVAMLLPAKRFRPGNRSAQ
jgi:hypothetical protein